MPKNVVIFSDGTGQAGGINFDEARTNVYKLYRACRVGPDTKVEPSEQVAFYDAGLGSASWRSFQDWLDAMAVQSRQHGDRPRDHSEHSRLLRRDHRPV
jgi:uncharacterized protein (DUF2235 family)